MRRGRVDEIRAAADELTEEDAVAKGGDNRGIGKGFCGVGDPKIGSKEHDEAPDHNPLGQTRMK